MLILGIAVTYLTDAPTSSIIVLLITGGITCGLATILTYKRWLENYIMYFISIIVTILAFLLMTTGAVITTYFLVYVNLSIMTLYSNFRAILFSSLLGLGFTIYLFISPYSEIFGNNAAYTIYLYLFLIALPLIASTRFSENLQAEATEQRETAMNERNHSQEIVDQVASSLNLLNGFSSKLKENVTSTSVISKEVTSVFAEISSSTEIQARSISDINESASLIEQAVAALAERTSAMRDLSDKNVQLTNNGNEVSIDLKIKMDHINETIHAAAVLMNQLNEQNKQITDIVTTINHISTQTNLLALNAAIEAARAGEHGAGFAVVSSEIRKLAESSKQSTEQISEILETIRTKTDEAAEQILLGQQSAIEGSVVAARVADAMIHVADNSTKVDLQAVEVEQSAEHLHQQYIKITEEISTIASITEETTASIKEVAANMNTQDTRIGEVVESFLHLDELAVEMRKLTTKANT
ncbi:chemotaxis protein [Paenibacillus albiflavus]|uniref:Chemotaxis protein n=2 Tax=Paenibacillus albiflavus TaxID=2545760 RepID=A0A4R4EFH4_9BACL|nr:chemotaxis protein [Paenibacillus albiflavus]